MGDNPGQTGNGGGGKEVIPVAIAAFVGALVGAVVGSQMS